MADAVRMPEASLCPFTRHRMQRSSSASLKDIISESRGRVLFLVFLRRTIKKKLAVQKAACMRPPPLPFMVLLSYRFTL